jgi:copper chaperone CopZ
MMKLLRKPVSDSILLLVASIALAIAQPAFAAENEVGEETPAQELPEGSIEVASNRVTIEVNGIVCSFCAYGLEKALGKMDGIDDAHYGNGVLVEIESQRVTFAFKKGAAIDFADVYERIKDAGYDPVRFHFRVAGIASQSEGQWRIAATHPAQEFSLVSAAEIQDGAAVNALVQLEASSAKDASAENLPKVAIYANY